MAFGDNFRQQAPFLLTGILNFDNDRLSQENTFIDKTDQSLSAITTEAFRAMAQMAHVSFPYFFTIPNSEF